MADYTPTLGDYTELKPFRFWCQKVLPLVYDDSLSYYELLCKVVDYLNKTMEDVDTLHDDVVNLHAAYVQLQTYVNTYFDNLDVQEEINNKLDAMAQDGSLSLLLAPYIPDIVSNWLDEHIEPTSPAIDNTLSVSGAGADAKVTGDNFGNTYSASKVYSKDDIVLYNGHLYKCLIDMTAGEAWNSAHWAQINSGALLSTTKRTGEYTVKQLLNEHALSNLGGNISALNLPNTYAGFVFVLNNSEKLFNSYLTKVSFVVADEGDVAFYLIDRKEMATNVVRSEVGDPVLTLHVTTAGYQTITLDEPLYIPVNKILAFRSVHLKYGAASTSAQYAWIISDNSSSLVSNLSIGMSYTYLNADYIATNLQLASNDTRGITYAELAVINLNTRTLSIPDIYMFSPAYDYGLTQAATVDFSAISYYVWIYFNHETHEYIARGSFNFDADKSLIMLIALGNLKNPCIYSTIPYRTVYGRVGFIGDSITAGDGGTPYCADVAKKIGMDFYNYGHSGCSFTLSSGNTFKDYLNTYADNLDVITIWGGINDFLWFNNYNIFESEFDSFVNSVITKYPTKKILIITPQKFYVTASQFEGILSSGWDVASSADGHYLKDYVDIEIKVANKYQVPVLDMFNVGTPVVNTSNRSSFYNGNGDWLHPNTNGYKFIANRIAAAILDL